VEKNIFEFCFFKQDIPSSQYLCKSYAEKLDGNRTAVQYPT